VSFGVAAAFGVVQFSGLPPGFGRGVLRIALTTIIFAVVFLGEEIGWRGYLLFRVAELTSGRRAALVTGFFHAIYHLPLLLIATTYQSAGKRWIVVPMVPCYAAAGCSPPKSTSSSAGSNTSGGMWSSSVA
jgi:membrane protease YdiL (CAAX protease family)